MKKLTCLLAICFAFVAKAQWSEGGLPPSFTESGNHAVVGSVSAGGDEVMRVPVTFDIELLKAEDAANRRVDEPVRIGTLIPFHADLSDKGVWTTLEDGTRTCRLRLQAPGATALSLYYDRFRIPEGGRLFIYNAGRTQVLGAYTSRTCPERMNAFATEYVAGDDLTLEYVAGADGALPEIVISEVGYGYNHLSVKSAALEGNNYLKPEIGYRAADEDMVDINCSPEGDRWQNEKRGVAKVVYKLANGQFYASGTLVNNAKQDGTMYWITADHNFRGRVTDKTFADMMFYFDNERRIDAWNPTKEPASQTIVGAEYLYGNHLQGGADVALLKITGKYEGDYEFFFNGWNVGDESVASGVSIHHPKLDVKKISTFTAPAFPATWRSIEAVGKENAHWGVNFVRTEHGFALTEKGSDGAPLFNQDGQVIGVLTGKNNGYTATDTRTYYGKLSACWDVPDPGMGGKTLADYLDSGHTGVTALAGRYADGKTRADFAADRLVSYLSETTTFTDHSFGAKAWSWSFPGAEPGILAEQHPTVRYTQAGTHAVTLTINPGTPDEASVTKEAYITVTEKTDTTVAPVVIGQGSATAEFPLGYKTKQAFDASLYMKEELGQGGSIYELGWQFAGENIAPQTVYIYLKETDEAALTAGTWAKETAGATLVYQGADVPWRMDGDWCSFPLAAPFAYSGDKNLKVLVRTVAKQEPLVSNECRYTEADGKHLQWTTGRSTIPTAAGTLNANRPNLRVGFGEAVPVAAPVADFAVNPTTTVFEADFEGEDFFAAHGWTVERTGASDVQWKQWTYQTSFTPIDPTSKHSAVCLRDGSREVNSRMLTPVIDLPEHCTLEFYAGYSGETTGVTFSISTDEGATWTELWTPGRLLNSGLPTLWRKQTFDLSDYAGKQIQLAWHFVGKTAGAAAVDNVKIYHPTAETVIYVNEGDRVYFEDRTAGPVVSRQWSFSGGKPATSSDESLWVQYDEAGMYDVTLKVCNSQGENAATKSAVVVVNQQQPQTAFTGTQGYKRKTNDGRFIPVGAGMAFTDLSAHHPRAWQWTFPGAQPEISAAQYPVGVIYPTAGDYDVTLETSNPQGGTDKQTATDYVRVGGVDSVWNMPTGDTGDKVYTHTGGYITGTNRLMAGAANGYSERFARPLKPCEIVSVAARFHVERKGAKSIKVSIYDDEFGLPVTCLATTELKVADIVEDGYTTIEFDRPVGVSDAFHVAFENFNSSHSTVDFAVAIKTSKNGAEGASTVCMDYERDNFDGWLPLSQEYEGYNLTLNVVPVLRYADLVVETTELIAETNGGEPLEVTVDGNVAWQAATDKMWIKLREATGEGNGTFTVSCGKNPGGERSGIVTVSGGGIERQVLVRQAGAVPADLTAEVTEGNDVVLSWQAPAPAEAVEYAEDVESHTAFTINSPGATGWSYIDGDGDVTFNLRDYRYANEGKPAAFMVFNPTATMPGAEALSGIAPYSGKQYFACFNAVNEDTDDWLISPELNMGEAFKFSFYAKTYDAEFGEERIRVLYSTTGKAENDFTQVVSTGKYEEVPTQWTPYTYVIPAEAKYVAINCVSRQSFMLMLDDLYIGTEAEAPAGGATGETVLRHGSEVNMDGFGYDHEATFEVAVLFDSEDLYACHGGTLTAVDFFPHLQPGQPGTASYTLKVRQGGALVLSQAVKDVKFNQYNRVNLDKPLVVDAAQTLQISCEVHDVGGKYPAGYNIGPAAIGRGNLISTDGGYHFFPLTDAMELDVNWCLAAVITPAAPQAIQYNIYKDNTNIGTVAEPGFTDEAVVNGRYDYHVSAVYGGNRESSPSNVCTVVIGESSVETAEAGELRIYPNVVSPNAAIRVVLETSGATAHLRLADLNGHEYWSASINGVATLQAPAVSGMYILEVLAADGTSHTAKLIVK